MGTVMGEEEVRGFLRELGTIVDPLKHKPLADWSDADLGEVNRALRRWQLNNHPDKGGSVDMCASMNARMDRLREAIEAAQKAAEDLAYEKRLELKEEERRREEARKAEERRKKEDERLAQEEAARRAEEERRERERRVEEARNRAEEERAQKLRAHEDGLRSLFSDLPLHPGGEGIPASYHAIIRAFQVIQGELVEAKEQLLKKRTWLENLMGTGGKDEVEAKVKAKAARLRELEKELAEAKNANLALGAQASRAEREKDELSRKLGELKSKHEAELQQRKEASNEAMNSMLAEKDAELRGLESKHKEELRQRGEASNEAMNSMLAEKDAELRGLESKHKEELRQRGEASNEAMNSMLAEKDGKREYDERKYEKTPSIEDVEQLKDELKNEKALHEQTKLKLQKVQTKIVGAMSALLADDEPSGGGAEGASGNETVGGAKGKHRPGQSQGDADQANETGTPAAGAASAVGK